MPSTVAEWFALTIPYLAIAGTLRWHFHHKTDDRSNPS